jgi:methylthioribose-1-phosphate isomerase
MMGGKDRTPGASARMGSMTATISTNPVRAWAWADLPPTLTLLDQTLLPAAEVWLEVRTTDALVDAIVRLAVRGAPLLGACGAFGVALALVQAEAECWDAARLAYEIDRVRDARPTAVNLAWGVDRVRPLVPQGLAAVVAEARTLASEDEAANRELSRLGADWILARTSCDKVRVVTHCNSGALATTGWGTAYGIMHELHDRGRLGLVYVDETRPLLQGSRLTSWELTADGIDHVIEPDGASSSTILRGLVDVAVIGADRIAANGDTANKVGSVALALACARVGVPFVVAAPSSTVDVATPTGDDIVIEERAHDEVLSVGGVRVAPPGARAFNPAFDVTPHDLISAIVTERGVVEPAHVSDVGPVE